MLSYAGEEHWFRFNLSVPTTIQVHLDNLPANYDLYVYSVSNIGYGGQSTNPGTSPELVTINNAPADDYMVRVVGVKDAFDPVHAYQLEIVVPGMGLSSPVPTPSNTPMEQSGALLHYRG